MTETTDDDRVLTPEELAAANARVFTPEAIAAAEAVEAGAAVFDTWEAVPASFASEAEEAAWWDTHHPSAALFARTARPVPAAGDAHLPVPAASTDRRPERPAATPINLRLEADTMRRLRALAAKKGTKYQTLLKQFVVERLYEEERREGLAGPAASRPGAAGA